MMVVDGGRVDSLEKFPASMGETWMPDGGAPGRNGRWECSREIYPAWDIYFGD